MTSVLRPDYHRVPRYEMVVVDSVEDSVVDSVVLRPIPRGLITTELL